MAGQTTTIAPWAKGQPESAQAWNADLNNIAAHYGVSLSALEAANPQITDPNSIAAGTSVNIPGGGQSGNGNTSGTGTSGSTTAGSPSGSAGGTTSTIPGQPMGPQSFDTSGLSAQSVDTGTVQAPAVAAAQQYQTQQSTANNALATFFGTGGSYAPQYEPQYTNAQAVAAQLSQAAQASAAASTSASSGSVT
jgi:hypothetical protein